MLMADYLNPKNGFFGWILIKVDIPGILYK